MESKETIAAISTGMTNSGISIVRISGDEAFLVIDKIYRGKATLSGAMSHTIHYGFIVDMGDTIDEVLVSIMRAPRTFTGEDTVEINCHGGMFVTQKILATVIKNGARLAQPGEFTKRAFLNGKMDLTQAESVMDVIQSQNEYALHSSIGQLKGNLKRKIEGMREMILYHTAYIETALDDPEHVDMENYGKELLPVIEKISEDVRRLIESADAGRIMKEGINTVILGKPNVGKSSLLNALSGYDRAIVTNIEGTTRDVLEEQVRVGGIVLILMVTGFLTALTVSLTICSTSFGSFIRAEPSPFPTILGTGQPMLRSRISKGCSSISLATSPMIFGSEPKSCKDTGCSPGAICISFFVFRL